LALARDPAQVLAVFEHACNLLTAEGNVIALVGEEIGNGPLNVVLGGMDDLYADLKMGTPATLAEHHMIIGRLEIDLSTATQWEPRPNWDSLRVHQPTAAAQLPTLQALCREEAPQESLLTLLDSEPAAGPLARALQAALSELGVGLSGDLGQLRTGAVKLTGLGGGLTPSGDDFLIGTDIWLWLTHPRPTGVCQIIADAAIGRTTTLSEALLKATARGECSEPWHELLAAMCGGTEAEVTTAARRVLKVGATSGADALAGFIWAAGVTQG
jgi:hypothetical protein